LLIWRPALVRAAGIDRGARAARCGRPRHALGV